MLYINVPEMLGSSLKISTQKYPNFNNWNNFFSANVSDFYMYFTMEIRNFKLSYLCKKL
jgi:hypothetical protein